MKRLLTEPFRGRTARETLYCVLALATGVFWFCLLGTLFVGAASLLLSLVGIPLLVLTLAVARAGPRLDRRIVRDPVGVEIPPPPVAPPRRRRWLGRLTDGGAWRALLYLVLQGATGTATFTGAVTIWAVALSCLTIPTWWWTIPGGDFLWDGNRLDTPWEYLLVVAVGLLALLAAPWVVRVLALGQARLALALLGPTRGELER